MAKSVARLSVSLRANTKQFSRGMKRALKTLKRFSTGIARISKRIAKFAIVLGTAGTAGIALLTKRALDSVDTLAKTAQKLGVNIGQLQAYREAAKQAGIAQQSFDTGIQRLLRRFGEFEVGSGEAKAALTELGIEAKSFADLDLDGKIKALAKSFGKITSPTQKLRLAFKLFDTEGVALVNLLSHGVEGLDNLMARIKQLGGTITREAAAKIEAAKNSMSELGFAFRRVSENFATALSPIIGEMASSLATLIGSLGLTEEAFRNFFRSVARGVDAGAGSFRLLAAEFGVMFADMNLAIAESNQSGFGKFMRQQTPFGFFSPDASGIFAENRLEAARKQMSKMLKKVNELTMELEKDRNTGFFSKRLEELFEASDRAARNLKANLAGGFGGSGAARQQQFLEVKNKAAFAIGTSKSKPLFVRNQTLETMMQALVNWIGMPPSLSGGTGGAFIGP